MVSSWVLFNTNGTATFNDNEGEILGILSPEQIQLIIAIAEYKPDVVINESKSNNPRITIPRSHIVKALENAGYSIKRPLTNSKRASLSRSIKRLVEQEILAISSKNMIRVVAEKNNFVRELSSNKKILNGFIQNRKNPKR